MNKILYFNMMQFGHNANHRDICKNLSDDFIVHYLSFNLGLKLFLKNKIKLHYSQFNRDRKILNFISFFLHAIKLSYRLKPKYIVVVVSTEFINSIFFFLLYPFIYNKSIKYLDLRTVSVNPKLRRRKIENYLVKILSKLFKKTLLFNEDIRNIIGISKKKSILIPLGGQPLSTKIYSGPEVRLIYIGAYINRNIDIVIKAYYHFRKDQPTRKSQISLIGYGDNEINKLKKLVSTLGLSDSVNIYNRMAHSEMKDIVAKTNIGISFVPINSYYNFQTPTKIFEYGLSGLFTIATNTISSQRIINKHNGILCNDTIMSLKNAIDEASIKINDINPIKIKDTFKNFEIKNIVRSKMLNKIFIK